MDELYDLFLNRQITAKEGEQILYDFGRNDRIKVFIILFHATLKNDLTIAYKVFREAYSASDNIFRQIEQSKFPFKLKDFLNNVKSNIDLISLMRDDEKKFYDKLPNEFDIYRGVCNSEHTIKNYGISWSLSKEVAEKYIYFGKNGVKEGEGGLLKETVTKSEILTVFSVHGEIEIIYIIN